MSDCEDIKESLEVWLDGELSPADAEVIRLHLEHCADCDQQRHRLARLDTSLKSLGEFNVPRVDFELFWRGVQKRIGKRRAWHEKVGQWFRSAFARPGMAWAVPALILIIILIGVFSFDSLRNLRGQGNNFSAVESIDAHGRNVALLREDETKTTVIWLYQNQEGEDGSSGENAETGRSF